MLKLLGTLQLVRYSPRSYVVASTDAMGTAKAQAFEQQQQQEHQQRAPRQARWRRSQSTLVPHRLLQHRKHH
jgi:Oligosaccharide biosynthesis protein Alg14 like